MESLLKHFISLGSLCLRWALSDLIAVPLVLFLLSSVARAQDYDAMRQKMVQEQLAGRDIRSKNVLDAMRKVERHQFVPRDLWPNAYNDFPLPIGEGQTISQPYVVAFMTEALQLSSEARVLEVGTGSGYQSAILAEVCKEVYTIEIIPSLAIRAGALLRSLGYQNIFTRTGDGYQGWPEAGPFDAIIVTCSPTHLPKPLQDQLKEGGKMIIPVGSSLGQQLVMLRKKNGKVRRESKMDVLFVPMRDSKGNRY
jgi:protein-L-isoaspartate(D-aspartate) O-methyltransferase